MSEDKFSNISNTNIAAPLASGETVSATSASITATSSASADLLLTRYKMIQELMAQLSTMQGRLPPEVDKKLQAFLQQLNVEQQPPQDTFNDKLPAPSEITLRASLQPADQPVLRQLSNLLSLQPIAALPSAVMSEISSKVVTPDSILSTLVQLIQRQPTAWLPNSPLGKSMINWLVQSQLALKPEYWQNLPRQSKNQLIQFGTVPPENESTTPPQKQFIQQFTSQLFNFLSQQKHLSSTNSQPTTPAINNQSFPDKPAITNSFQAEITDQKNNISIDVALKTFLQSLPATTALLPPQIKEILQQTHSLLEPTQTVKSNNKTLSLDNILTTIIPTKLMPGLTSANTIQPSAEAISPTNKIQPLAEVSPPANKIQSPTEAISPANKIQPPAEVISPTNKIQPPAEVISPTNKIQPPAEIISPANKIQPPAEAISPANKIQPQVNAISPANNIPSPAEAIAPANKIQPQVNAISPANNIPSPAEVISPTNKIPSPAEAISPTNKIQPPAEAISPTNKIPSPAEVISPTNKIQPPAEVISPANKIQPPAEAISPANKIQPPLDAIAPANNIPSPAEVISPTNKIPLPAEVISPTNKIQPPAEAISPANKIQPPAEAISPTNKIPPVAGTTIVNVNESSTVSRYMKISYSTQPAVDNNSTTNSITSLEKILFRVMQPYHFDIERIQKAINMVSSFDTENRQNINKADINQKTIELKINNLFNRLIIQLSIPKIMQSPELLAQVKNSLTQQIWLPKNQNEWSQHKDVLDSIQNSMQQLIQAIAQIKTPSNPVDSNTIISSTSNSLPKNEIQAVEAINRDIKGTNSVALQQLLTSLRQLELPTTEKLPESLTSKADSLLEQFNSPLLTSDNIRSWMQFLLQPLDSDSNYAKAMQQWLLQLLQHKMKTSQLLQQNNDNSGNKTQEKNQLNILTKLSNQSFESIRPPEQPTSNNNNGIVPSLLHIPLPPQQNNEEPGSFTLQRNTRDDDERGWNISLYLEPAKLGPIRFQARIALPEIALSIVAEKPTTVDLIKKTYPILEQRFQTLGLIPQTLQIRQGKTKKENTEPVTTSGFSIKV